MSLSSQYHKLLCKDETLKQTRNNKKPKKTKRNKKRDDDDLLYDCKINDQKCS